MNKVRVLLVGIGGYGEKTRLFRSKGGWDWEPVCECDYAAGENWLAVQIPRAALGSPSRVDFKWMDNMQNEGDILDAYQFGDAMPYGRFMFRAML